MSGERATKSVGGQIKTGLIGNQRERWGVNPLVAGSSPARNLMRDIAWMLHEFAAHPDSEGVSR
jgi:hypothetical protein